MEVIIIGAGLTGLSCAMHLLESGQLTEIHLFDARAEIGSPQRKPGLIGNVSIHTQLLKWGVANQAHLTPWGGRRAWIEKGLAQQLESQGVHIHVRQRVVEVTELGFQTADGIDHSADHIIDAMGSMTGFGRPGDPTLMNPKPEHPTWYGGVLSREELFEVSPLGAVVRSDGSQEVWSASPLDDTQSWIERFEGQFAENHLHMDASIEEGIALAETILTQI